MVLDRELHTEIPKDLSRGNTEPGAAPGNSTALDRNQRYQRAPGRRAVSHPRATQRRPPQPVVEPEELLRQRLRELSKLCPRSGVRRAETVPRMESWKVNNKRLQRSSQLPGLL